jgi:2-polyprenyl-6-methoxyphenol hydroxylase-like FAD-dependent oxidoreductase
MERRTQVLIVGAGPVGLSAAIELGHRSIGCLLIERNDRVGHAPRAKTTNVRTREHLRRWGIADALRDASPLGIDYPSDIVFVTKLSGYPLARFENAFHCAPGKDARYSEHAQWVPQYRVEEVLRDHVASLPGVTIEFRRELLSLRQDERGVHAQVRNLETGAIETIRCDYLIGADGSRSTVRDVIGVHMHGTRGLSRNYNVVFRAPGLDQAHSHGRAIMYWQVNQRAPSLVGPMDRGDKWFLMPTQLPSGMKLRDIEAPSLIREATGIDLPYEISPPTNGLPIG